MTEAQIKKDITQSQTEAYFGGTNNINSKSNWKWNCSIDAGSGSDWEQWQRLRSTLRMIHWQCFKTKLMPETNKKTKKNLLLVPVGAAVTRQTVFTLSKNKPGRDRWGHRPRALQTMLHQMYNLVQVKHIYTFYYNDNAARCTAR